MYHGKSKQDKKNQTSDASFLPITKLVWFFINEKKIHKKNIWHLQREALCTENRLQSLPKLFNERSKGVNKALMISIEFYFHCVTFHYKINKTCISL